MDGLFTLLSLCIVMATASFLVGLLPLALKLSSTHLRLISALGMGVLVGTSLIVIIPEGVDTLYSSNEVGHQHVKRWQPDVRAVSWQLETRDLELEGLGTPGPIVPDFAIPPKTTTEDGVVSIMNADTKDGQQKAEEEAHHAWIGIALIAGFILMFLIDKLPQYTATSKPRAQPHHIALNNLRGRFNITTLDRQDEEAETFLADQPPSSDTRSSSRSFATTTGLVIHAAADGIALGASSSTSNTGLSFVIFFAIMVHKAPAAFGLTSVLLKQGLSKRAARAHLVIFSLAAPAGAFLTWMLVHLVGGGGVSKSAQNSQWWTGMLLLFSAGTFLYVAMHAMQEVTSIPHDESRVNGHANGSIDGRNDPPPEPKPSVKDLGAACFGMILPLFLQIGHAH